MLNEKDMEAKNLNDIFWQSISDNNLEKSKLFEECS